MPIVFANSLTVGLRSSVEKKSKNNG